MRNEKKVLTDDIALSIIDEYGKNIDSYAGLETYRGMVLVCDAIPEKAKRLMIADAEFAWTAKQRQPKPDVTIKIVKTTVDALLPTYAHEGDSCADLYSTVDLWLWPESTVAVPTGLIMEIPKGWGGFILSKSGLALNRRVSVRGGVIDSNYRDEVKVILTHDNGSVAFRVEKGMKIAQIEFRPVHRAEFVEVEKVEETERKGGFGSTGAF